MLRTRSRRFLTYFSVLIFELKFMTGSDKLPLLEAVSALRHDQVRDSKIIDLRTANHESAWKRALIIAIIAAQGHTWVFVCITLDSLNDVYPKELIQIIHHTLKLDEDCGLLNVGFSIRTSRRFYDNPLHVLFRDSARTFLASARMTFLPYSITWLTEAWKAYAITADFAIFELDAVTIV